MRNSKELRWTLTYIITMAKLILTTLWHILAYSMYIFKSMMSEKHIKIISLHIQSFADLNNQILSCCYAAMYLVLLFFHFPTFKFFFFPMTALMTWHFLFFVHIITAGLLSQISISLNFQHLMHNASISHRETAFRALWVWLWLWFHWIKHRHVLSMG